MLTQLTPHHVISGTMTVYECHLPTTKANMFPTGQRTRSSLVQTSRAPIQEGLSREDGRLLNDKKLVQTLQQQSKSSHPPAWQS